MRGFLIDPFECKITEVDYSGDFHDIYSLIDCDTFTCVVIDADGNTLYLDDEGLINGKEQAFFMHSGYPEPLAGKALVLGTDDKGETVATTLQMEDLKNTVAWTLPVLIGDQLAFLRMQ